MEPYASRWLEEELRPQRAQLTEHMMHGEETAADDLTGIFPVAKKDYIVYADKSVEVEEMHHPKQSQSDITNSNQHYLNSDALDKLQDLWRQGIRPWLEVKDEEHVMGTGGRATPAIRDLAATRDLFPVSAQRRYSLIELNGQLTAETNNMAMRRNSRGALVLPRGAFKNWALLKRAYKVHRRGLPTIFDDGDLFEQYILCQARKG